MTFETFQFVPQIYEGLNSIGFEIPTPIQQQAIPLILQGRDLVACAQTGTGKTAAFLLPVLHKITANGHQGINTLVIVPTRELAMQIDEAIQALAYFTPVSSIAIYGGNDGMMFEQEKKALREGADIIIATPGRLLSHIGQGYARFDTLQHLILDEADRMLDMGFHDDIMRIIARLPKQRQTLLFSATMPPKIRTLANKLLTKPAEINIATSKPAEGVMQGAYVLYETQKLPLLKSLLTGKSINSVLIFSSTKEKVKRLESELRKMKVDVAAIHSDLDQNQRIAVLRKFSSKQLHVLVATDILSRGIDIDSIGLVVNFDVPGDAEDYVHRVGRTARADTTGMALTFINEPDQRKFKSIEDLIGYPVKKLPMLPQLGEVPEYNPAVRQRQNNNRRRPNRKSPRRK